MRSHRYPLPHSGRSFVAVVVAGVLVAACGSQGEPSVGVKGLDADVVFGVKTKAGTQAGAGPSLTGVEPDEEISLVPADDEVPGQRRFRQDVQPTEPCPEAAINAFPAEPATDQVTRVPTAGLYRWKRGGTSVIRSVNHEQRLSGFEERLVENVRTISESENPVSEYQDRRNKVYVFDTVQPFGDGVLRTTYQVKTNAEVQREARPFTGNPRARAGDPERGLAIMREVYEERGEAVTEKVFSPGLLLVPLPMSVGENFSSVSQVSREGTVTFTGTVAPRERIDACGDMVEAFRVRGTMERPGLSTAYNILVATQLGALIVQEQYEFDDAVGTHDLVYQLGQLKPSPLPGASS